LMFEKRSVAKLDSYLVNYLSFDSKLSCSFSRFMA
jgi:hypothetical protein